MSFADPEKPDISNTRLLPARIAFPYNLNAYGMGRTLRTYGLNDEDKHETVFETEIIGVVANDIHILVLLDNGALFKVKFPSLEVVPIEPCRESEGSTPGDDSKEFFTHMASGRTMSLALSNHNHLYELFEDTKKLYTFPENVKIDKMCHGIEHCLILTTDGEVYSCGSSA